MENTKCAACKFCGQYFLDVALPEDATEEDCLEIATEKCRCGEAMSYQHKKRQASKAKIELASIAMENPQHNIKGVDSDITELLENAIDIIADDKIHSVKVGLCSGGTIEIKCTSSGKITVVRSTTVKQKRAVE